MSGAEAQEPPGAEHGLRVWDSQYAAPREAFAIFREGVCSSFMPWTPEPLTSDDPFEGRIESVLDRGRAFGISSTTGLTARKTKCNISRSSDECIYGNFVLSGEMTVDQAGKRNVAGAGDLILYHSYKTISLSEKAGARNVTLAFSIPVSDFSNAPEAEQRSLNTVIRGPELIEPLAESFGMLARRLRSSSIATSSAIFDACVSLLPVALGCFEDQPGPQERGDRSLRAIMCLIEDHLHDSSLSPSAVASEIGISSRQLHKYFSRAGTTFGRYVMRQRLERVHSELRSVPSRKASISTLAFRWGFEDLSTFNRAFRRHYGYTPRSLRI